MTPMSDVVRSQIAPKGKLRVGLNLSNFLLVRRNTLVVFMSLELMLVAATLALVAFSRFNGTMDGNVLVFFILTVAAAEVAVGLALIVALFRRRRTVQLDELNSLRN